MIKCGEDFTKGDRPFNGFATQTVRCADDLPGFHPAAREQCARNARPMIAAGILVDRRRATELTPNNYGHILVKTALVQVLHEGGNALIEQWQVRTGVSEILPVIIPKTK